MCDQDGDGSIGETDYLDTVDRIAAAFHHLSRICDAIGASPYLAICTEHFTAGYITLLRLTFQRRTPWSGR